MIEISHSTGEVKVGLIYSSLLEPLGMAPQYSHHFIGCSPIEFMVWREIDPLRTELPGSGYGHGRADARAPRLTTRC
jgi:hypothetical protein